MRLPKPTFFHPVRCPTGRAAVVGRLGGRVLCLLFLVTGFYEGGQSFGLARANTAPFSLQLNRERDGLASLTAVSIVMD